MTLQNRDQFDHAQDVLHVTWCLTAHTKDARRGHL